VLGLFFNTQYKLTPKTANLKKWIFEYFRIEELVAVNTAPVPHPYQYDSVLYQFSDGTTVHSNDKSGGSGILASLVIKLCRKY
jgi:hypothetical protein